MGYYLGTSLGTHPVLPGTSWDLLVVLPSRTTRYLSVVPSPPPVLLESCGPIVKSAHQLRASWCASGPACVIERRVYPLGGTLVGTPIPYYLPVYLGWYPHPVLPRLL